MNKEQILEKIKKHLADEIGEKTGGSGHLSHISISDITIDNIKKTPEKQLQITLNNEYKPKLRH